MTVPEQHPAHPPLRGWRALLVLALLAGLMGMHALAPGAAVANGHAHPAPLVAVSVPAAHGDCDGAGHCGTGHVSHADTTCAAAAVSGGPVLPALVPDPVADVVRDDSRCAYVGSAPDSARAPPSLAELQLLRI
ncbi:MULTISPECIES: DUF6153 family protein [unclassified Streptomyces]|uniref:DUF6153 family protein n=1 Tax=unclassified Streptomyces TaxID=2593676 RepID=UPI0036E34279